MKSGVRRPRAGRRGFTLVELLTVIAIIALLAAILFPVIGAVRENVRKGQCTSNLHALIQAAQMYKDDWKVYPDALFGVEYGPPAVAGGPLAQPFATRLFPEYVKDRNSFTCPNHPQQWKADDTLVTPTNRMTSAPAADRWGRTMSFARRDSYDLQYRPNTTAGAPLLNYATKWSTGSTGLSDDPRQLVYKNAPDTTVVTWCLYHSSMDSAGNPGNGTVALVGFLSGRVQTLPAAKLANWPNSDGVMPWQVQPKP